MRTRRLAMVLFLVGLVFLSTTLFLRAVPPAFQCKAACTYMCACEGMAFVWDECCGYCWYQGYWLDCCNNTCGN